MKPEKDLIKIEGQVSSSCKELERQQGCTCCPESQSCPRLHQWKHRQQAEGGDVPPLLHSHETPPGALHAAQELPTQGNHGQGGVSSEGHKNDQRTGAPLLWGKAELRFFRLEKKRFWAELIVTFQYLDGTYGKDGDKIFSRICCNKTRGNGLKPKRRVDLEKK